MTSSPTLAAIVNDNPGASRILERHRLDYCCGGRRTLDQACHDAGVDAAAVLAELDSGHAAGAPADWASMSPAELVDHLEATHHAYLHEELPRLDALARKVAGVHAGRHPELTGIAAAFATLRNDLEPHLMKEERILFPMIRDLAASAESLAFHCGSLANPVGRMLWEHDRAGELLAELRALTGDYTPPADACASYQALYRGLAELEADTHLHVHKENNVLFPAVLALEHELRARGA